MNTPVTFASNFHAGGDREYARDGSPTLAAFEAAIEALEGGAATSFASGMAAVAAVLGRVPVGGTVVVPTVSYAGLRALTASLAERDRLRVAPVDIADTDAVRRACEGAAMVWVESPTNPTLDVADLPAIVREAHAAGALVAVDNTFATPLLARPLEHGADLVVHSATKYLAGHSDLLLGVVVAARPELHDAVRRSRTLGGALPGPMETYLALRGLRTLPLRLAAAQATAGRLAERLLAHPTVARVRYPGLPGDPSHQRAVALLDGYGAIVTFDVGTAARADAVVAACELVVAATSLGGVESSIERRAKLAGEEHLPPGLLRLSVGCEDATDLWRDLDRALAASDRRR